MKLRFSKIVFYVSFATFIIFAALTVGGIIFAHFNDRTGFLIIGAAFVASVSSVIALVSKCLSDD